MDSFEVEILAGDEKIIITIEIDSRLRTTARWIMRSGKIHLRVPKSMSRKQIEQLIKDITPRIARQRNRARRQTDINLVARAEELNRLYFDNDLSWHSIRWVNNMVHRLGSFTTGGTTDGDIRLSERIRTWPDYVIDYILAHEMCHRKYPNHSPEFWEYLARYPHTQRALGFLDGLTHAEGGDPGQLTD